MSASTRPTKWAVAVVLAATLLGGAARGARAAVTVETIRYSGPSEQRVDVVLLGDGFAEADQGALSDVAAKFVAGVLDDAESGPFHDLAGCFNVHVVKLVSNDSCIDHEDVLRDQDCPADPRAADGCGTALDCHFCANGIERAISCDYDLVAEALADASDAGVAADFAMVLVNSTKHGGTAGTYSFVSLYASDGYDWIDTARHELGHHIGGLGDEYETCYPAYDATGDGPNVTRATRREDVPWSSFIAPDVPLPTFWQSGCRSDEECGDDRNARDDYCMDDQGKPVSDAHWDAYRGTDVVGLWEGARYFHLGWFRPTRTCRMRNSNERFCPVCYAATLEAIEELCGPTDEVCDGFDNDRDGEVDEADAEGCTPFHRDADGDGFGTDETRCLCAPAGEFRAGGGGDCDDGAAAVNPAAAEACNDVDDDCDGAVDEPNAVGCDDYYPDLDEDGWGAEVEAVCLCDPPDGWPSATRSGDCDDRAPLVNPGMRERCDGRDDDCDGQTDDGFEDLDGDDAADCVDDDDDDDGWPDITDSCPRVAQSAQLDLDGDGLGDACDDDDDGDGVPDRRDVCPLTRDPEQEDSDGDGVGDRCALDADGDGVADATDLCPTAPDPAQADFDGDGVGDRCDDDDDDDGVPDAGDNCPFVPNHDAADQDGDGLGDACDPDRDGDGVADVVDVCVSVHDPGQADLDRDGDGDACDPDDDGDGLPDDVDLCPRTFAPIDGDLDGDGDGDACDPDVDGDRVVNELEAALGTNPREVDSDGDGWEDGDELTQGSLPLDPDDYPGHPGLRDGVPGGGAGCSASAVADEAGSAAGILLSLLGLFAFVWVTLTRPPSSGGRMVLLVGFGATFLAAACDPEKRVRMEDFCPSLVPYCVDDETVALCDGPYLEHWSCTEQCLPYSPGRCEDVPGGGASCVCDDPVPCEESACEPPARCGPGGCTCEEGAEACLSPGVLGVCRDGDVASFDCAGTCAAVGAEGVDRCVTYAHGASCECAPDESATCPPVCAGRTCGEALNGCGGDEACGACPAGRDCISGRCLPSCSLVPDGACCDDTDRLVLCEGGWPRSVLCGPAARCGYSPTLGGAACVAAALDGEGPDAPACPGAAGAFGEE